MARTHKVRVRSESCPQFSKSSELLLSTETQPSSPHKVESPCKGLSHSFKGDLVPGQMVGWDRARPSAPASAYSQPHRMFMGALTRDRAAPMLGEGRPVVRIEMSTMPVRGSVADCFRASRCSRLASSTSMASTLFENRTFAWASAKRISDSSCRGYADTIPRLLPTFLMST